MLIQSIGDLLPSAVGVAISPIPIIAIVLMLATPRARSNGLAFSLGWVVGLSAVMAVVLLVAGGAGSDATDDGVDWATLAFGLVFLGLARRQWSGRPKKGEEPKMPGWLQAWSDVNPVSHLSDGFRGLLLGGPVAEPVTWSLVWAAGIALVFYPLAMRAYRAKT